MARKQDSNPEAALKRAFRFLSYRPRSEAEVRIKLTQSGFSQEVVAATLEKLHSLNFLNDEAFARGWAQGRAEGRGYGPLRIERELRQKGVANNLIRQVVDETYGREEGKETARELLEKRYRDKDLADTKILRRAIGFLKRRGYRDSVIAEIVGRSVEND
jgi:regulatory protein